MNKSAKEMFEELGYYYRYIKGDCSEDVIQYQDFGRTVLRKEDLSKYIIQFNLMSKCIVTTDLTFINIELLQAINQQCKELGWLDDQRKNLNNR